MIRNLCFGILVVALSWTITCLAQVFPPVFSISPLNISGAPQFSPSIYGHKVAYNDYRTGSWEVYLYDLIVKQETQITNTSLQYLNSPRISQRAVVWADYRGGTTHVWMYDLLTHTQRPVDNVPSEQEFPAIDGANIVWDDTRDRVNHPSDNGKAIYLYNIVTGQERRITDYVNDKLYADISGNRVVWVDFDRGHYYESDIFMTDIRTGEVTHITENSTSVNTRPRIWGNTVVWEDYFDTSNPDIYMYDIPTQTTTRLTFGGVPHAFPVVYGNTIAWQDNSRTPLSDIVTYNIRTRHETWLTDSTVSHIHPAIYQNSVVWQDYRNGRSDVFLYYKP